MRAVAYCRISRDPTGTELGVKRQEADCRALCDREGYEVVDVLVDDDRSAYSGKPRPGFGALRELVAAGGIDVVVAWHPDRLTRHPRELEDLIDLLESTGTAVRTCQTGEYDLSTPSGRMTARIVGNVARAESEHKSARLRRKHVELAEAGAVSGGGDRPFGYEPDRVTVRAVEADVIRDMARQVLAGDSIRSTCRDLNARGLTTTSGRAWYPGAVTRLLASPRIAGLREHHGMTSTAVWPAIVEPAEHYRLRAVLTDPARRKNQGGRDRKLLTGLVVCELCGAKMVSRPNERKVPGYVCAAGPGTNGCGRMRIGAEPLDELITAAVLHRLDSPALTEALTPADDDTEILAELRAVAGRTEELATMWAAGELSRAEWSAAGAALAKRQAALEADLRAFNAATTAAVMSGAKDITERWPDLTNERRRAILATVIDTITIGPAVRGRNTFDPDRVTVNWKA